MKPADVNRFSVVCALVSDLYCPGYNPRQTLGKESNLIRTAVRYKVEAAKVAAAVRGDAEQRQARNNGSKFTVLSVATQRS
jgi:hypothetical protein